jgi:hypothetical protein
VLSSIPNFFCCITKPFRNKVTLKNESEFKVKYEVYIYKGSSVGKTALEIIQAEALKKEVGYIPVNGTRYATCGYGGKIAVRYMFEDLHHDYTDELRNFEVLDIVQFLQPSTKEIEMIRQDEEKERMTQRIEEAKQRMCSSKYGHMCSASDIPKQQCWKCRDWYCNYHARPNNNPFGKGGHICN